MTSATTHLDLSQQAAVAAASEWLSARVKDPKRQQVFRIGGHAGSGKTTIIKEIIARFPDLNIAVTTYTGKASQVLRGKGVPGAINLHQIFYVPDPVKLAEKMALSRKLASADESERAAIRQQIQRLNKTMFKRVETIPYDLVIVDEASMVPGRITEDLLRYGKPVLAVGDPAQLGPIEKATFLEPLFAGQSVDAELVGQHRVGSPILAETADAARHDRGLPDGLIVGSPDYASYDAVLVFSNRTRWSMISKIRKLRGKPTDEPVPGDELMVQRNDHTLGLFNGSTFTVAEVEREWSKKNSLRVTTTDGDVLSVDMRGFTETGLKEAYDKAPKGVAVASFCEAMTVHKAQGSEWDRVLVAEDHPRVGIREDRVRWRYTAVTRARETLHVASDRFRNPVI